MKLLKSHPLLSLLNSYLIDSPQPVNISYLWNFGSLLGVCLVIQIITGITLAMHYTPSIDAAFISVEHIMRDVNYGWLIRYLHANTASFFFLFVYAHMARGLYYGSYRSPRVLVWSIGVVIFLVMIITAFLGYVLPYGQMSLWGATVITNLMSAIPWIGQDIVEFIWGGFSVSNATLNRFFSLHYLLPFVLAALIIMHMIALHESGSNNPVGVTGNLDRLAMHPYFIFKDFVTIVAFFLVLSLFVFYAPNVLGHSDNYIPANPMQTPASIVPEWYLLPFYAILRSIPNKLLGVLAMIAAILVLFLMPIVDLSRLRGNAFKPFSKIAFAIFAVNFLLLMWLGSQHVESPYVEIGQICTAYYFAHFLIIIPAVSVFENTLMDIALSETESESLNKQATNANASINTSPVTNTPLVYATGSDRSLSDLSQLEQISQARNYSSKSNPLNKDPQSEPKGFYEYIILIKRFLCDSYKEIIFGLKHPAITFIKAISLCKANLKYIFVFKNFYVSIMLAGFSPQMASWLTSKANQALESSSINLMIFWITISLAYFFYGLGIYHSIRAANYAYKKGTMSHKLFACLSLYIALHYSLCILFYYIPIEQYFIVYAEGHDTQFPDGNGNGNGNGNRNVNRAPSSGVDSFNDSTGRGGNEPAPNVEKEIAATFSAARDIFLKEYSFNDRVHFSFRAGKRAYNAALSGNIGTAIAFGIIAAVSALITALDLINQFKTKYDEYMKNSE